MNYLDKLRITKGTWTYGRDLCVSVRNSCDYDVVVATVAIEDYLDEDEIIKANADGRLIATSKEILNELIAHAIANEIYPGCEWAIKLIEKATGEKWEDLKAIINE